MLTDSMLRMARCRRPTIIVVLSLLVLLRIGKPLLAQTSVPDSTTKLKATLADLERGPHTGPVETALVGLEIYGRHGNGFVLACDGFLLIPFDLFDLTDSQVTPNLTITFSPGTDHEQRLTMPRRSRYFVDNRRRYGFTVFRADGYVHAPALRTMLPEMLKPGPDGDTVEVVWIPWDPVKNRFGPMQKRRVGLAPMPVAETEEQKKAFQEATEKRPGFVKFATRLEDIPAGAVVLGPEGLAIGVVPGGARGAVGEGFVSFSVLNEVTNCVGPIPTPDGQFHLKLASKSTGDEKEKSEGTEEEIKAALSKHPGTDEMVSVPGGPVIVPKVLLADQSDMELEEIACVAPFQIDKYEVTNQQYKAFWDNILQHLTDKERMDLKRIMQIRQMLYPMGWNPDGEPFPPDIADLPVIGVPLAGAKAYAKWVGKRLPTPYEWAKAALGPKGESETPEWARRYILARQEAWSNAVEAHRDYLKQHIGLLDMAAHMETGDKERPFVDIRSRLYTIPWMFWEAYWLSRSGGSLGYAERFSKETSFRLVDQLMSEWKDPIYMLAVGSRPYDVSPYGAMDMLLNADEMYLPNPQTPVAGGMRYIHLQWIPDYSKRGPFGPTIQEAVRVFSAGFGPGFISPFAEVRFSRLYKRVVADYRSRGVMEPYPLPELAGFSNVMDLELMLYPLNGWYLYTGRNYELSTDTGMPLRYTLPRRESRLIRRGDGQGVERVLDDIIFNYQDTPWFAGPLRYAHRELGRPPAQQGTLLTPRLRNKGRNELEDFSHDLFYILPVGFRCAR